MFLLTLPWVFLIFGDLNIFAFSTQGSGLGREPRARGVVWQLICAFVVGGRILKRFTAPRDDDGCALRSEVIS